MPSFWLNRRVIVTGGGGFLGGRLVSMLNARGADVYAPSSQEFDLRYRLETQDLLWSRWSPQVLFHLAANVGGIGATSAHPGRSFYDNAVMGLNVIEAARTKSVEKIIVAGSVCAYPLNAPVPLIEENLWNGYPEPTNAPYGEAKRMMLTMLQAYRQEYGMNGVYLLFANLYGPGQDNDPGTSHVIPALIRKFLDAKRAGGAVTVWGTGNPSRDFLYVDDAARALIMAAEHYDEGEPVNVGSGREIRIASLVEMLKRITEYDGLIVFDKTKPDGQPRRCLDIRRARERFGWEPSVSFEDGLRATVERMRRDLQ